MGHLSYKTSAADAAEMASIWYQLAGVPNPSQKAIDWWTKQIQQDGSHTAFLNFANGKGQDAQSQFDPSVLASNAAKLKAAANIDPWQPDPTTGQLAGTNTKNLAGLANEHPLLAALYASGGNPITGAGVYNASHSGGTSLDYLKGALTAAAVPAAVSTAGALAAPAAGAGAAGTTAAADAAGTAIPDAATMAPGELAQAANASRGGSGGGFLSSIFGSGSGIGGSGLTTGDLLKGIGGAVSAGTSYAENQANLAERKREFDAQNALAQQNAAMNEGQLAVQTQNRLNTAPLADQSQYMLKSLMSTPPQAFHPRDYTQAGGSSNTLTPATGGAAAQLAANEAAAASYKPGAGGVDTSSLKQLLGALKGSQSAYGNESQTPGTGTAVANTASATPPTSPSSQLDPDTLKLLMQRVSGGSPTASPTYA